MYIRQSFTKFYGDLAMNIKKSVNSINNND